MEKSRPASPVALHAVLFGMCSVGQPAGMMRAALLCAIKKIAIGARTACAGSGFDAKDTSPMAKCRRLPMFAMRRLVSSPHRWRGLERLRQRGQAALGDNARVPVGAALEAPAGYGAGAPIGCRVHFFESLHVTLFGAGRVILKITRPVIGGSEGVQHINALKTCCRPCAAA